MDDQARPLSLKTDILIMLALLLAALGLYSPDWLAKVSEFKLPPDEAHNLMERSTFLDSLIALDQPLCIGSHRHDVVVIGDVMIDSVLNRPSATRYQELDPAITDTAHIQQEILYMRV